MHLNKKKVVKTAGRAQALQVVPGTSLLPASGTVVLGPPRPADLLTELPCHSTSSNTSSRGQPPQKASPDPGRHLSQ
ncbi:UNVERIFIED_CONTAM: hypothetical protein Slati_0198300 [Sesamum latifolium]|uniref:Uncharacterized protein n=1 Tax=Sesamum latifolium TaxID=2727402 RepID=A0AAW2YBA8_9LAMI